MDPYLEIEDFHFALHDNTVGGWWVLSIVYCQDGVESCIEICRVRRCKKRDQGVLKSYKNKLNWTQIYKDKFIAFIVSVLPHNANKTCKCTLNEVLELFLWIIYQNCAAGEWSSQVILHDLLENILSFCWKYLVADVWLLVNYRFFTWLCYWNFFKEKYRLVLMLFEQLSIIIKVQSELLFKSSILTWESILDW